MVSTPTCQKRLDYRCAKNEIFCSGSKQTLIYKLETAEEASEASRSESNSFTLSSESQTSTSRDASRLSHSFEETEAGSQARPDDAGLKLD